MAASILGRVVHEVTNQVPPLVGYDVAADPALLAAVDREGAGWYLDELHRLRKPARGEEAPRGGEGAHRDPPLLPPPPPDRDPVDEGDLPPARAALLGPAGGARAPRALLP